MAAVQPRFLLLTLSSCFLWISTAGAATLPAGFSETRVATGLLSPTAMAIAPDGRIFVAEKGGALRVVKNNALLAQPFLTLSVSTSDERGLLGAAFDPDFQGNRFVYVYYTTATEPIHNRVSRFTASSTNPDVAQPRSELPILNLPTLGSSVHNGGGIHFGNDGKLYVAVGENLVPANSQSLNTPLGKLLRINSNGSIPSDNPFYSQTTGVARAIWALGPAQSLHFRGGFRHRSNPCQRCGPGCLGGSESRRPRSQLWMAANRRAAAGRSQRRALSHPHVPERRSELRHRRRDVLPTADLPVSNRVRWPLFLRRLLRRLHPHVEPAELLELGRIRHGHQFARGHPSPPRWFAVLPRAWRRRTIPRAIHHQHHRVQ